MISFNDIFERIKRAKKLFVSLFVILFLNACGGCETFQGYLNDGIGNNCLLCGLFDVLTEASTNAATKTWNMFARPLAMVSLYATAIYIAFNTLKSVGSFGKFDFATYLTADKKGMLFLVFKMAVIFLLLTDRDLFIINSVIIPIMHSGLVIGQRLIAGNVNFEWTIRGDGWPALFSLVNDGARAYNDELYNVVAMGKAMMCNATDDFVLFWYWLMLCYGMIFFVFGWSLLVATCFYIIDLMLDLALAAMLLPLGITFMISNQTTGYGKKIWEKFMGVFFGFVMLGVILGLSIQLMLLSMGEADSNGVVASNSFGGNIRRLLDSNNVEAASERLWSSGSLLLTIVCFAMLVQVIDNLKPLVSSIAGVSPASSAGSKVGGAVSKPLANAVAKPAKHIAKSVAKEGGHAIYRIARLDKAQGSISNKLTSARGFLFGTGSRGYKAWWRH